MRRSDFSTSSRKSIKPLYFQPVQHFSPPWHRICAFKLCALRRGDGFARAGGGMILTVSDRNFEAGFWNGGKFF
jgi:hypothetical protein